MEEIRQADKRREEKSQRLCDEQKVLHQKIDRTKKLREARSMNFIRAL